MNLLRKEQVYGATCVPIDSVQGEHALRAGLTLYQEAGEISEMESFYEIYRRMLKAQSEWLPEDKTRELLSELVLVEEEESGCHVIRSQAYVPCKLFSHLPRVSPIPLSASLGRVPQQ